MKLVALVQDPKSIARFLRHLGEPREPPVRLPDRRPAATHPWRPRGLITPPTARCAREAKFGRKRSECGRHGAQLEPTPKRLDGSARFSTRPRLAKPRLFRLRSEEKSAR